MNVFDETALGTPLPNFPHVGDCNCPECDKVYYERKEIRQREIKEIEAIIANNKIIANNNSGPFGAMVTSIIIAIVGMLSFLAGVMVDKRFDIF